jgi:hypothetical protein
MAPERTKRRQASVPQASARHLFSAVVEKRKIDVTMLDERQLSILEKVLAGESVFITGAGG